MTTRRLAIVTAWALSLLALAGAFSLQAAHASPNRAPIDEVLGEIEVAIEPISAAETPSLSVGASVTPEPIPTPAAALAEAPTPIAPPEWIEIPADLIATPTPTNPTSVPLPMLTNIASAPRDGGAVYLTFDDGPNPTHTVQILDLLAQYNAKATFFVLGSAVDNYPEIAQRIVTEGHTLGNHTYYHEALPRESAEHVVQTLQSTNNAIARATGHTSSCMRPPYGSLDQPTFDIVSSLGYTVSMWEVDSNDWRTTDGYAIAASVLRDTNLGNRVLMHDGPSNRAATVAALESILSVLSNRGVQFHALPCLA